MKKITIVSIILLFTINLSIAQVKQFGQIRYPSQNSNTLSDHLRNYLLLEINLISLRQALQGNKSEVHIDLNIGNKIIPLVLYQNNILSEQYHSSTNRLPNKMKMREM